jgi:chemotaxis signal transduction protein
LVKTNKEFVKGVGDVDGGLRHRNDVVVKAGGRSFVVPAAHVMHIAHFGTVSPIPFPVDGVEGLVAAEGRPLCLVDLAKAATGRQGHGALMVVVDSGCGPIGLRVDSAAHTHDGEEDSPPLPESLLPRLRGQRDGEALRPVAPRRSLPITLLAVTIAGKRVAVPAARLDGVAAIDEIMAPPPRAQDIPDAHLFVRLGDDIIAIKATGPDRPAWVLRLSRDGLRSGLGVDGVGDLFRAPVDTIRSVFGPDGRASSWLVDEGGEILPILDPLHLLWPDHCAEHLPGGRAPPLPMLAAAHYAGLDGLYLSCDTIRVAVPLAVVKTVLGRRDGEDQADQTVPVIDMAVLLGLRRQARPGREMIIALPGRGEVTVSADDVRAMTTEKPILWQPIPPMPPPAADVFDGIAADDWGKGWMFRLRGRPALPGADGPEPKGNQT